MNINEKYIMVKTDELIPYEKNARTHSKEQIDAIADSFKRFGIVNPFLITADKNILAGHCRLLAAKQLGIENVPCILVDNLTADEQRAYIIADNKLAEAAGWDMDILTTELFELKDGGFELSLLGFSDMEISQIEDLSAGEIEEDDFDVELPKEPKSKVGDVYSLGDNRLMCGDSTNSDDVAKLMSGAVADMVLTDPPYNIAYVGKTKSKMTMQNDKMDDESYQAFLAKAFAAAKDILKDGGTFYIWHADNESFSVRKACNDVELKIRQCLIWVKSCISLGRQDYQWKHEPCLYGWKDGAAHYFVDDRTQTTVIFEDKPTRNADHPTMKPLKLLAHQIKNSSKVGEIIFDGFAGSGSSLIAAAELNRKCYAMEIDPKYVDVIIERWETATGEKAIKIN